MFLERATSVLREGVLRAGVPGNLGASTGVLKCKYWNNLCLFVCACVRKYL